MGTALLALCFCALSLLLALFVSLSPISEKAKIRFMYVGAALSLMAVPMISSCACVHRRCVLLLLRHGKYDEVQCHEEKDGGA